MRLLAAILAILIFAAGCAAESQASKQAGQGAALGAVGGAVSGSMADNTAKERAAKPPAPDARNAELRKRIGDKNWASALLLAQCRHKDAIASAADTLSASQDPGERSYALLIQGIAAEESGDKALAAAVYPKMGGSVDKARADTLEGVIKVQATRREHGLPPCT